MSSPSGIQDIATAFSGLDISEALPPPVASNSRPPRSRHRHCRGRRRAAQSSTTSTAISTSALLNLPAEIRLQIYDLLLVRRHQYPPLFEGRTPHWALGDKSQKLVDINLKYSRDRTMHPAILRACKQIYREAVPVLYSRNVFNWSLPDKMLQFLERAGPDNIKMIRFLQMRPVIWCDPDFDLWLTLLNTLAVKCTGLRHVRIHWHTNERAWRALPRGDPERGMGDSLAFVRALAKIKGLERMTISGYYGKHWPACLERETGAYVREEPRFSMDPTTFLVVYHDYEDPKYVEEAYERRRGRVKKYESLFRDFQKDTEDLIP